MGDFNINIHKMHDSNTLEFEQLILSSGFAPLISTYTHQKPNCKESCIDNILTNNFNDVLTSGCIEMHISHHLPIFQISNLELEKCQKECPTIQYYDFSKPNVTKFGTELENNLYSQQYISNRKLLGILQSLQSNHGRCVAT